MVISHIRVVLETGTVIDEGSMGIEVDPGNSITYIFDSIQLHRVRSVIFTVEGTTEELKVWGDQAIGPIPGGAGVSNG